MSVWVNYDQVISDMESLGLDLSRFEVGTTKDVRCRVAGEKGTKGWYRLHEQPVGGEIYLVGSYGVWHGNDNNAVGIKIPRDAKASKEDNALVRKRIMADQKKRDAELKRSQQRAAVKAMQEWRKMSAEGESGYLARKQIKPFGVRFSGGALVVPMLDTAGAVHGLQFILDKSNPAHQPKIKKMDGSDKRFWPTGMAMHGHFCLIGAPDPRGVNLVCEGYATGASLHMATGLPVFVAFNAGNILPVLLEIDKHYPRARFLICGDDDYLCRCGHIVEPATETTAAKRCAHQVRVADDAGKIIPCSVCNNAHGKINTGVSVAMKATMSIDHAAWVVPQFVDRTDPKTGKPVKWTDFNDLHVEESIQAVEAQITAAIADKFPTSGAPASPARDAHNGGAGKGKLRLLTIEEAVEQYALVYGVKDTMFDCVARKLVPKSCVLDITRGRAWDDIKTHPDFLIVDIDHVGFDASESDPSVHLNMFGGMDSVPCDKEPCDAVRDIIDYLVASENEPRKVRHELLCWLAYPLQNPGAKIDWSIVMHGDQGAGKSILFEKIMIPIYGKYATLIGQEALDDKFNEWASKKLFIVADEVVARQELYHTKNVLKKYITGKYIPINPKNVAKYTECNQMNFVFLSNEDKPVVLEDGDRRYLVIRTPETPPPDGIFKRIGHEIEHGGIASFHAFLMNYDCGDFDPHGNPIMTYSKEELLSLCKEPPIEFADEWLAGSLDLPVTCCLLDDLYQCFRRWSDRSGERFIATKRAFSSQLQRHPEIQTGRKARKPVMQANGKAQTKNVVLISDDPKPDGETMMTWLAARCRDFQAAMGDF